MADRRTAKRAAENQDRVRAYNEHIEPHNRAHHWEPPYADWVCECADETCSQAVQLTVEEYEGVRADPTHFLVAPGDEHVIAEVEQVVRRHERYWIVEKLGEAGEISEELDNRDRDVDDLAERRSYP